MKKVLFVAVALVAAFAFSSCKKTCTCTEATTGVSKKMETDSKYSTCKAIQDLFEDLAKEENASWQKWSCK
ncbi:MAG: hypothetical protein IKP02_00300 [Paludibacteraceae bacterium]|jgi:hypothetical protein|nr:hypothetical protein [Paludibacteraceae bacterium]MBR4704026.1 hypothetical protein [Paludibacteraceae bacterium]